MTSIPQDRSGYLYVLKSDHGYKIGKTRDLKTRMSFFTLTLPFKVELIHTIPTNDYHYAERVAHKHFEHKHINGEWYDLDEKDLSLLLRIPKMDFDEDDYE